MNRFNRYSAFALLASVLVCPWCAAQVKVTFPLNGHYRVGRYMPVRVTTTGAVTGPVVIRAEGAVAVSVAPRSTGVDTVVPWLAAGEVRSPRWQAEGGGGAIDVTLTPVEPRQVLIGVAGVDVGASTAAAAGLFPGKEILAVPLSGTPPIGGNPDAWEALDAVVFDAPDSVLLADLLANGMTVIIRSDARPRGRWPWQGRPGRWFVKFEAAGPTGAVQPEVYDAVAAWRAGWPAPLRRRALLLAGVFCLLVVGVTLWRRTRLAALAVVASCAAAVAGFAWWGARQPLMCEVITTVSVMSGSGTQDDHWTYLRPLRRREVGVDWAWRSKPVFASARHVRETDLILHVGAAGRPFRFTWRAEPGTTLAFLNRSFSPYVGTNIPPAARTPLTPTRELASSSYLGPGDVVLAESGDFAPPDDPDDWWVTWPPVTIRRGGQ